MAAPAIWGLGHGIPAAQWTAVAEGLLARLPGLSTDLRARAETLVRRYGTPDQIDALGN